MECRRLQGPLQESLQAGLHPPTRQTAIGGQHAQSIQDETSREGVEVCLWSALVSLRWLQA